MNKEYFTNLLDTLKDQKGGAVASKSHLGMALVDWNKEQNWVRDNAYVLTVENKGYAFITITKREPRHCTLRHVFVLEQYRGESIGRQLIALVYQTMQDNNVNIIRFFANKPAIKFYERLGYSWLGESKGGLPFTYTDINTMQPIPNEKQLKKLFKPY
jgi:GNAT superfamily N-acetyltransferase